MEASTFSLPWSQGAEQGTLHVNSATKASELKLLLNNEACAAVMGDKPRRPMRYHSTSSSFAGARASWMPTVAICRADMC